jgi:hypothetical protein
MLSKLLQQISFFILFHPKNCNFSSIRIHVVEYFATSAKILSNVTKNIRNIFHLCYQKMVKNISSSSHVHAHKLTLTFTCSQYNNPTFSCKTSSNLHRLLLLVVQTSTFSHHHKIHRTNPSKKHYNLHWKANYKKDKHMSLPTKRNRLNTHNSITFMNVKTWTQKDKQTNYQVLGES